MADEAVQRRALELFERLTTDPSARELLTAGEPVDVVAALHRLERAAPRAQRSFPTEDDREHRAPVMALPDAIGAYRLTSLLGEGGMGLVFAAERSDGLFEHRVAIKLIHPERLGASAMARFNQERRLLARLEHPGIARLIDGGVTRDGWPYIVMERIDGPPIDAFADARKLGLRARVQLLKEVCAALQAAHAILIVHGDIKPDNILVDAGGRPRLLDFGVARYADGDAVSAFEPRTLAFAAPERCNGAAPTIAADIYALGVLLRCLIGQEAGSEGGRIIADRGLSSIVDLATATQPESRYLTVEAFAADLGRWLSGKPVQAHPPTFHYIAARFVKRHPYGAGFVMAALLALLATLGVALQGWQEARARVRDLRDIAHYQLVDLDQRLERVPHTVALRAQLAQEANAYLDRLSRSAGTSPSLRLEAADGFRRLAQLQGAADRPSLGDTAAARVTLRRAEALVDDAGGPAAAALHARILIDHARIASAATDTAKAQSLLRQADPFVVEAGPAGTIRAEYLLTRSEVAQWAGQYPLAARLARAGRVRIGADVAPLAGAMLRARAWDAEAEARYYDGDIAGALELYSKALDGLKTAARRWPDDRSLHWSLAKAEWALGTTALDAGDAPRALPLLDSAYRAAAADADADPADQVAARRHRGFMLAAGQTLLANARIDEGSTLISRSVELREAWWRRAPADSARLRDWMIGVSAQGDALASRGQVAVACRLYDKAGTLVRQLSSRNALTMLDRTSSVRDLEAARGRLGCVH